MTRDEAVAEVQTGLGFRTDLDTLIVTRMQQVQVLLERGRTLPWFLLEEEATVSVAAAANDAPLPTGFIRETEYKTGGLRYVSDEGKPVFLQKVPYDESLLALWREDAATSSAPKFPSLYALRTSKFVVYPAPTAALTLYLDYFKAGTVLDSDITNVWLTNAPYLVIGNTGASVARTLKNTSAFEEFSAQAQTAWSSVLAENVQRQAANRRYVLGRNS